MGLHTLRIDLDAAGRAKGDRRDGRRLFRRKRRPIGRREHRDRRFASDNAKVGAVWSFTRSGSTWTQQGAKLLGSGESGKGSFGSSVALSSDGTVAIIGGQTDKSSTGAAWAFTRSGSTWTQQGSKLTGTGEIGSGKFGSSVALSSDATTAMIGATADNTGVGAAFAFTRSGSTWTQQAEMTGNGEVGEGHFGSSVALSSDGNTSLIGAQADNGAVGAAFPFTRSGSTLSQEQGPKLVGSDESGTGHFGESVALASDGNSALIGAYGDGGAGAVFPFRRTGSTWSQLGPKLTGTEASGSALFGMSVAMASMHETEIVGGSGDAAGVGAAWAFDGPNLPQHVEYGRCLKTKTGGGTKYSNAGCTSIAPAGEKENFEWYPAFGSAKPLGKDRLHDCGQTDDQYYVRN